jgi:PPOX class probable F420-dependent enzyme
MSRNMTSSECRGFLLHGTRTAKIATVLPDGTPHVAPVWFVLDGDQVVFTTGADSVKGRNLRRDPRVTLVVDDETPPFAFVHLRGIATISSDLEELRHFATEIGARYMGKDRSGEFGRRNAVPGEILVRVTPLLIVAQDNIAGY